MKPTAIYNFAPISEKIYVPTWPGDVSQDIPFSDGEDGTIELTLHNITPLFIRNGTADRSKKELYSANIKIDESNRLYYIPATSIKGMLRSTMEVLSYAKLTDDQYNDSFFGYRDFGGNTTDGHEYVEKMKGSRPGWLRMDENGKLFLAKCIEDEQRISYEKIESLYHGFSPFTKERVSSWQKNKFLHDASGNKWYPSYNGYRIVCTGNIYRKNADFLFPEKRTEEKEIPDLVKKKFFSVHDPTPDFDNSGKGDKKEAGDIKSFLREGNTLAVFYIENKEGDIDAIGLSKHFRYPHPDSVKEIVARTQGNSDGIDLPRRIFGYISKEGSLKGRVTIGNAWSETPLADSQLCQLVSGVLGKPKASFYPFYIKQEKSPYIKIGNPNSKIAGRKVYRIHEKDSVSALPSGNDNDKTITKFYPVPKGMDFNCRISIHNLKKVEIGALLSSITLHKAPNVWHSIGLAKGYGYGKLSIKNITMTGLHFSIDEYLSAFENEMDKFVSENIKGERKWINSEQIKALFQIHSEHPESVARVMTLDEYKAAKKNENFWLLNNDEPKISVHSLSESDTQEHKKNAWRKQNKDKYEKYESFERGEDYLNAKKLLDEIIKELELEKIDSTEEINLLNSLEKKIQKKDEDNERNRKEDEIKEKRKIVDAGLRVLLEEKYPEGPNAGKFKIQKITVLNSKVESYKKKKKALYPELNYDVLLTEDDLAAINETKLRIQNNGKKKH